ncbi:Acetylornithine deacetylase/Succinyl-diaminopimelate desuccinylase or related deacylase [Pseudomonas syringae pv. actinidiae]|uniref:Acetylornithine deacetylase/Succinyl-diaminopimelate desuccinylase or related deacylase n=1 Tax=Pseudomonas syringae pv. actinidiae TaxID=103796 RepID=A0A2V0QBU6_PSESF|nr:Acetylornithine deacetylase/Succinyl-diaminopimelate desuccinylase or related deacylase [Pseudomonas syringae pv. actinidiae]
MNQADGYVQDIANSGYVSGSPFITAWVVGQSVAAGVATTKTVGDEKHSYGQVRATTYGALVSTANLRLMRLRKTLEDRYNNLKTDALLLKVLATQEQASFDLDSAPAAGTKVSTLKEAI